MKLKQQTTTKINTVDCRLSTQIEPDQKMRT